MKLVKGLLIFSAFATISTLAAKEKRVLDEDRIAYDSEESDEDEIDRIKAKKRSSRGLVNGTVAFSPEHEGGVYIGVFGSVGFKTSHTKFSSAKKNNDYTISGYANLFGANTCLSAVADAYAKELDKRNQNNKQAPAAGALGAIQAAVPAGGVVQRVIPGQKLLDDSFNSQLDAVSEKFVIGKKFTGGVIFDGVVESKSPMKYYSAAMYEFPSTFSLFPVGISYIYKEHSLSLAIGAGLSTAYLDAKIRIGGKKGVQAKLPIEIKDFSINTYGIGGLLKYDYKITTNLKLFALGQFFGYGTGNVVKIGLGISHFLF